MREGLAQACAGYALGLAALAAASAARARRPRLLDGGLAVLELALVGHLGLGAAALAGGRVPREAGVYAAYLAASVLLLPAVATGAADPHSRWNSLALAIGCVAVGAVALRMLAIADG